MPSSVRRGLARTHMLAIAAVVMVVGVLSITRLQLFAVYENERDAVTLLEYIGAQLGIPAAGAVDGRYHLRTEVERAAVHVGNPADSQWLADGRVLRRRGYLYDLAVQPGGGWCLRAWPWKAGTTGIAAYAFTPDDGLLGHCNRTPQSEGAPAPIWSGSDVPPRGPTTSGAQWQRLEDSRRLGLASRMN